MLSEAQGNRILQYLLVLIISISINFFLPRLMPGNPLALLAGAEVGMLTPEEKSSGHRGRFPRPAVVEAVY